MPPLDEGTLLYMPTTLPGISVAEAQRLLQIQDRILKRFPGSRAACSARPAARRPPPTPRRFRWWRPRLLKPRGQWRKKPQWYSACAPEWLRADLAPHLARPHFAGRPGGRDGPRAAHSRHLQCLDHAHQQPRGHAHHRRAHARRRQDLGADLNKIQQIGEQIETLLPQVPGTRSVYAERMSGGYFLDFNWNRDATGPLRPDRGRRGGLHHVGRRRRERHHHRRRPRALLR